MESLAGADLTAVEYLVASDPEDWDQGDWHLAEMGVRLATSGGEWTITWRDGAGEGIEVSSDPLGQVEAAELQRIDVSADPRWAGPIGAVEIGPLSVRLDLAAGPVWLVAASPKWDGTDDVYLPGTDVMVLFDADGVDRMGLETGSPRG